MINSPLLSIRHATVRHLNNTLLKNLNITFQKGENWAIIGRSGSGKSALLQTIAGQFTISIGELNYFFDNSADTMVISDVLTNQDYMALVGSKHHFRNLSNTAEFYYQQRYNSSDSEDTVTAEQYLSAIKTKRHNSRYWTMAKAIKTFNLGHLLNKQLIKLSNGETKRLLLAGAIIKNPLILLLDMPLTGLDLQTRSAFDDILEEITASGITVIMATSPGEIPGSINKIAVLEEGTISQVISGADFDPKMFRSETIDHSDIEKLKRLFADSDHPTYNYMVKMTDVTIKYGEKIILNNLNWEILPGERWALLGPNGAGKSTLLSLINGDNPQAYANDIILFDRKRGSGESIWDIKSKIGFVSPELHQYFPAENSCLQVIESGYYDTLGLFRPSQKTKAEAALKWMKALDIEKYSRTLLKNIPASAQRLCLLARALIKNPDLLIFDEPCQGMDEYQLEHFKQLVNAICEISNVTLIYVTHYKYEIPDSVTKVLLLEKGEVVSS